jgi:hypothetical protein
MTISRGRDGRLANSVTDTSPDGSPFWTHQGTEFLENPVCSHSFPPAKNLEL